MMDYAKIRFFLPSVIAALTYGCADEPRLEEDITMATTDEEDSEGLESDGSSSNTRVPESSDSENPQGFCGDQIVDPGELCDDGNDIDGDECNSDCTQPGSEDWHLFSDEVESKIDHQEVANDIGVDPNGNIYVLENQLVGTGISSWLRKLDPRGNVLWARSIKPEGQLSGHASRLFVTSDGAAIVHGIFQDPNNQDLLQGLWVAKYATDSSFEGELTKTDISVCSPVDQGNQVCFAKPIKNWQVGGLTLTPEGFPVIAGSARFGNDTHFTAAIQVINPQSGGIYCGATMSYTDGLDLLAGDVTVDQTGEIFVAGRGMNGNNDTDFTIHKFAPNCSLPFGTWAVPKAYQTPNNEYVRAIAVSEQGIFVSGTTFANNTGNAILVKLSQQGELEWVDTLTGEENSPLQSSYEDVKLDEQGRPVVVGFDKKSDSMIIRRLDTDTGMPIWSRTWKPEDVIFSAGLGLAFDTSQNPKGPWSIVTSGGVQFNTQLSSSAAVVVKLLPQTQVMIFGLTSRFLALAEDLLVDFFGICIDNFVG